MRISDIFAQGGGDYHHDKHHYKKSHYSFGGYYGSSNRIGFGYYNGYNRGNNCCYRHDDNDGLLNILD